MKLYWLDEAREHSYDAISAEEWEAIDTALDAHFWKNLNIILARNELAQKADKRPFQRFRKAGGA